VTFPRAKRVLYVCLSWRPDDITVSEEVKYDIFIPVINFFKHAGPASMLVCYAAAGQTTGSISAVLSIARDRHLIRKARSFRFHAAKPDSGRSIFPINVIPVYFFHGIDTLKAGILLTGWCYLSYT